MRELPAGSSVRVTGRREHDENGRPAAALSGVEHDIGQGTADADEAVAFLEFLVGDGECEVLIHLSFEALLHAGGAGAAAAVVGEAQPRLLGGFEDVLVLRHVYGDVALFKGYSVLSRHQPIRCSARWLPKVASFSARRLRRLVSISATTVTVSYPAALGGSRSARNSTR